MASALLRARTLSNHASGWATSRRHRNDNGRDTAKQRSATATDPTRWRGRGRCARIAQHTRPPVHNPSMRNDCVAMRRTASCARALTAANVATAHGRASNAWDATVETMKVLAALPPRHHPAGLKRNALALGWQSVAALRPSEGPSGVSAISVPAADGTPRARPENVPRSPAVLELTKASHTGSANATCIARSGPGP